jgi:hypothetical protein
MAKIKVESDKVSHDMATFSTIESWTNAVQEIHPNATIVKDSTNIYSAIDSTHIIAQWNDTDNLGWS